MQDQLLQHHRLADAHVDVPFLQPARPVGRAADRGPDFPGVIGAFVDGDFSPPLPPSDDGDIELFPVSRKFVLQEQI